MWNFLFCYCQRRRIWKLYSFWYIVQKKQQKESRYLFRICNKQKLYKMSNFIKMYSFFNCYKLLNKCFNRGKLINKFKKLQTERIQKLKKEQTTIKLNTLLCLFNFKLLILYSPSVNLLELKILVLHSFGIFFLFYKLQLLHLAI